MTGKTITTGHLTAIGKDLDDLGGACGCRPRVSGESDHSYREAVINRIGNQLNASNHVAERAKAEIKNSHE